METISEPRGMFASGRPVILGTGFFDGVHIGHQLVFKSVCEAARAVGGTAWALTFDKHPLAVLRPSQRPVLLSTPEERLELLRRQGLDGVLQLPFTRELAVLSPAEFVARLFEGSDLSVHHQIHCGENWRFGLRAEGTPDLLRAEGKRYNFSVHVVPYAYYRNEVVSSTRVRAAVQSGGMNDVRVMLGRPWSVEGLVLLGAGRGTTFGFPTANLRYTPEIQMPFGVYAVSVEIDNRTYQGLANFGEHPTVGRAAEPIVEAHCFEVSGDFHGKKMRVEFEAFIRPEILFPNEAALRSQIASDIRAVRRMK